MFNYAFTDPQFTSGEDENFGVLLDAADNGLIDCSLGDQFTGPDFPDPCDASAFGDITGKQIPRTAEHQLFVDVEYRQPVGGGNWEWFAGANYSYESSKYAQVTNFAETGDSALVGARFGFESERYNVSVWGKNLTGEDSTPLVLRYADGANSFRVEASLNDAPDLLRPGMQGVAKINAGQARLIWIWSHEIIDRVRLWLWSWLP